MSKNRAKKPADFTDLPKPIRRSAISVPVLELQERLARARAALAAVRRAPDSEASRALSADLSRQISLLTRDITQVM